ncbi:MAG: hypothetical protein KBT03_10970 [Bacteroidales bacterium]|nr:hypothetical protein [Candidatus Scybalousia scybalohippi]
MIDYRQILNQIRQNNQAMSNQTIQSVYDCLNRRDHNGLIELYKNTCKTVGQQPNPMFIK